MLNANKRSVTINLKDRRGQQIVLKLLEDADVLVENYLDGVMASFGLAYDQIAARFPRLIYASGKGYGSTSRYAKLGSMDNTIQASSGFISITGFPDRPVKTSATFIDMGTGSHMVSGILAALIHRGKTGRGQHVEVAMLDVAIPALTSAVAPALQGMKFKRLGNRHWARMPDQRLSRARRRDTDLLPHRSALAHAGETDGREYLIADPRCRNHGARLKIADELDAIVSDWTGAQARDAIVERLIEAEIPCAPVRTVEEVIADPETAARRMLIDSEFPTRGPIRVAGTPIKMSDAPEGGRPTRRPPRARRTQRRSARLDRNQRRRAGTPQARRGCLSNH